MPTVYTYVSLEISWHFACEDEQTGARVEMVIGW